MLHSLPIFALVGIFVAAAAIVWGAGTWLADTTDILSSRFHLGQALAGTILLAVGTNLPELAITSTAAVHHNLGIAVGNLLGGIAIQTVVLAALDIAVRGKKPLTYRAASITLVLESVLVVAVLAVAILGTRLAPSLVLWRITPQNLLIVLIWLGGLWMLKRASKHMPWTLQQSDAQQKPAGHSQNEKSKKAGSTAKVMIKFGIAALATLGAGIALEESGDAMAGHLGLSGVLFGATVLAASTSIPELSTGITSVHMEDYQLAMSDIFGGNAFLPVLFLLASLLSGTAVLPQAHIQTSTSPHLALCLRLRTASGCFYVRPAGSLVWASTRGWFWFSMQ